MKSILKLSGSFIPLRMWEGFVTDVGEKSFMAKVFDLTVHGAQEIAEIPFDQILPDDINLVTLGAIFTWEIGYYDHGSGQQLKKSSIKFRCLPGWSKEEMGSIKENTAVLREELNWK